MNAHLELLLSTAYAGALAPEHLADLRKSGITDETRVFHRMRSVPLATLPALGLKLRKGMRSTYLIPFPAPGGGWMDHVKVRAFSDDESADVLGDHVEEHRQCCRYNGGRQKYLVPRESAPRLYSPIPTMRNALEGPAPLWIIEGMKEALAVMQLGLPVVGIESAWSWHVKGSRALLLDFAWISLRDRLVELVPDSDVQTNAMIARSMRQLVDALRAAGARPRLVRLPAGTHGEKVGIDDYLLMSTEAAI
jgi:uncharacterized protein DUF3854